MCGIAGFNWENKELIHLMNSTLTYRGPDNSSIFVDDNISLGHTRLSIIDLETRSNQPMSYKELVIVFNGEIYNFIELKGRLINKGYKFTTESDTEVVLASYLEYGPDCVRDFNGMWSFAIFDKRNKILFCSRDRFGKKPFYYLNVNDKFIFGSSIRSILKHKEIIRPSNEEIDKEQMELFFSLGFIPSPNTIFRRIKKLQPGENLIFDISSKQISKKYIYFDFPEYQPQNDSEALESELQFLLSDSVKKRLISDVPVGAFLSGGIDSTAVVSLMKKYVNLEMLNTFSIGFEGKWDESKYINLAAQKFSTIHNHKYFKMEDYQNLEAQYSEHYDEPFADYSSYPTLFLSHLARNHVTVCLSGDGGDEIFGGYDKYRTISKINDLRLLPKLSLNSLFYLINKLKGNSDKTNLGMLREGLRLSLLDDNELLYEKYRDYNYVSEITIKWFNDRFSRLPKSYPLIESIIKFDLFFLTIPDQYLVKVDRASMANSLEVRSPFLDHRIVSCSSKIPINSKVNRSDSKILLKKLFETELPNEILQRSKQGFNPPLVKWISNEDNQRYASFINNLKSDNLISLNLYRFLIKHINSNLEDSKEILIKIKILKNWFTRHIK